jgi:hypothetical protein
MEKHSAAIHRLEARIVILLYPHRILTMKSGGVITFHCRFVKTEKENILRMGVTDLECEMIDINTTI